MNVLSIINLINSGVLSQNSLNLRLTLNETIQLKSQLDLVFSDNLTNEEIKEVFIQSYYSNIRIDVWIVRNENSGERLCKSNFTAKEVSDILSKLGIFENKKSKTNKELYESAKKTHINSKKTESKAVNTDDKKYNEAKEFIASLKLEKSKFDIYIKIERLCGDRNESKRIDIMEFVTGQKQKKSTSSISKLESAIIEYIKLS